MPVPASMRGIFRSMLQAISKYLSPPEKEIGLTLSILWKISSCCWSPMLIFCSPLLSSENAWNFSAAPGSMPGSPVMETPGAPSVPTILSSQCPLRSEPVLGLYPNELFWVRILSGITPEKVRFAISNDPTLKLSGVIRTLFTGTSISPVLMVP